MFEFISGNAIELGQTDDWQQTDPALQNARLAVRNCSLTNVTVRRRSSCFGPFYRDRSVRALIAAAAAAAAAAAGYIVVVLTVRLSSAGRSVSSSDSSEARPSPRPPSTRLPRPASRWA